MVPNWTFPTEFQYLKDLEMVTSKSATSLCSLLSSTLQFINTGMDFALGSSMCGFLLPAQVLSETGKTFLQKSSSGDLLVQSPSEM